MGGGSPQKSKRGHSTQGNRGQGGKEHPETRPHRGKDLGGGRPTNPSPPKGFSFQKKTRKIPKVGKVKKTISEVQKRREWGFFCGPSVAGGGKEKTC